MNSKRGLTRRWATPRMLDESDLRPFSPAPRHDAMLPTTRSEVANRSSAPPMSDGSTAQGAEFANSVGRDLDSRQTSPQRPFIGVTDASLQRHQTGHLCIVQYFRASDVESADSRPLAAGTPSSTQQMSPRRLRMAIICKSAWSASPGPPPRFLPPATNPSAPKSAITVASVRRSRQAYASRRA